MRAGGTGHQRLLPTPTSPLGYYKCRTIDTPLVRRFVRGYGGTAYTDSPGVAGQPSPDERDVLLPGQAGQPLRRQPGCGRHVLSRWMQPFAEPVVEAPLCGPVDR